jgi:hypothetical protein
MIKYRTGEHINGCQGTGTGNGVGTKKKRVISG